MFCGPANAWTCQAERRLFGLRIFGNFGSSLELHEQQAEAQKRRSDAKCSRPALTVLVLATDHIRSWLRPVIAGNM